MFGGNRLGKIFKNNGEYLCFDYIINDRSLRKNYDFPINMEYLISVIICIISLWAIYSLALYWVKNADFIITLIFIGLSSIITWAAAEVVLKFAAH